MKDKLKTRRGRGLALTVCATAFAAMAATAPPAAAELDREVAVVNGNFEDPYVAGNYTTFYNNPENEERLRWELIKGGVDVYSAVLCGREDEMQCVDLNGHHTQGGLGQVLPNLAPGARIKVTFDTTLSMHPSCAQEENVPFRIRLDGRGQGARVDPIRGWETHTFSFVATKESHRVSFESMADAAGKCGAVLADVRAAQQL
ncbi:DUF642 domain-containing protein [Actinokineospora sp. 24-640]